MGHAPGMEDEMKLTDIIREVTDLAENLESWIEGIDKDKSIPISKIATDYWRLKEQYKLLDEQIKRIYHVQNRLEKGLLPERMEAEGTDMIRVPEIGRSFSVRQMMSASMVDKDEALKWLRDNGQGDVIQETVNAGTLASLIRNMMLEQGLEPPAEIIKVTTYNTIGSAKYTPKKGT